MEWQYSPVMSNNSTVNSVLSECHEVTAQPFDKCSICYDHYLFNGSENERCVSLPCGHTFHPGCIRRMLEMSGKCAICNRVHIMPQGDTPQGSMRHTILNRCIHGYPDCDTIEITYRIPSGTQSEGHPNPGRHFTGTTRLAYLPNNEEGNEALQLLKLCWERRLTFTIGTSLTTGESDTVIWNGVHHKTNLHGGPSYFGWPDEDYFDRLKTELAAKGITTDMLQPAP